MSVRDRTIGELTDGRSRLPDWAQALTPRKLRFVEEYRVDFNGRQAVLRAGLSINANNAKDMASVLLRDADVMAAIDAILAADHEERRQLRLRVVEELSAVAFSTLSTFVTVRGGKAYFTDTDEVPEDLMRSLKRIKETPTKSGDVAIEVECHDKIRALEVLKGITDAPKRKAEGPPVNNGVVVVVKGEAALVGTGAASSTPPPDELAAIEAMEAAAREAG